MNNKKLAGARFRYLFKLKLMITLIVSFFLFILAYPLAYFVFQKPPLFLPLIFSAFFILVNSIGNFYSSYFYIIRKLGYVTLKQVIFEILRIFGVLAMFLLVAKQYYVIGAIGVLVISMCIAVTFLAYNLYRLSPFLSEKSNEIINRRKMVQFILSYSFIGSLLVVFGYIDTIMIGIFLEASYVGYYNLALSFVIGIWGFLNLSQILLPIFTELNNEQIHTEFNKVFRYICMLALPAIFGIFVIGKYLLVFIKEAYLPAEIPFYVLSVLVLIVPLIDMFTPLFSAKDKLKIILYGIITATIMNIVLNYIFITLFLRISETMAMIGAALSTIISQLFYLGILMVYSKKYFNVHLELGHIIKPLLAAMVMFFVLTSMNKQIADFNLFIGIAEIFSGIIIYFAILFFIKGIRQEDVLLVKDTFLKFL
ncbi:MAG: polysaccharide biosynthesis C-terminal domain-containing protein [Nanoarchaeota archaeon]